MNYFDQCYRHPRATQAHRDILVTVTFWMYDATDGVSQSTDGTNSFTKSLCKALLSSDRENRERIRLGFPELVAAYEDWLHHRGPFELNVGTSATSPN